MVCDTSMGTVPDALKPLVLKTREGADRRASVAKRRKVRLREVKYRTCQAPVLTFNAHCLLENSFMDHNFGDLWSRNVLLFASVSL